MLIQDKESHHPFAMPSRACLMTRSCTMPHLLHQPQSGTYFLTTPATFGPLLAALTLTLPAAFVADVVALPFAFDTVDLADVAVGRVLTFGKLVAADGVFTAGFGPAVFGRAVFGSPPAPTFGLEAVEMVRLASE